MQVIIARVPAATD